MRKILFMPFLSIPSGHHQVADSLIECIRRVDPTIVCEKVDIFHYSYGKLEALASRLYLSWITMFPNTYSRLYRNLACNEQRIGYRRYAGYERLFLKSMKQLLEDMQPDLLICTHALPSNMAGRLRQNGQLRVPVINVYTDFFVNDIWGGPEIDYHFVPNSHMKQKLTQKGTHEQQIFITGIPVHSQLTLGKRRNKHTPPYSVLITGGSHGIGAIKLLIQKITSIKSIQFHVLCGHNKKLYRLIKTRYPSVIPLPYIQSRKDMNELYESMDGVLTKPGGVTISECIRKRIPIFIYDALPGQEEINLEHLKQLGFVYQMDMTGSGANLENQLLAVLSSEQSLLRHQNDFHHYHGQLIDCNIEQTLQQIVDGSRNTRKD